MTVTRTVTTLVVTNSALFLGAMLVGGRLLPETLGQLYAHTQEWHRGFIAAPIYALVIAPQVLIFKHDTGVGVLLQSVIAMIFISGMGMILGQREWNWRVALATVVACAAVYWLSLEVQRAVVVSRVP